jgi:hypothetical protein
MGSTIMMLSLHSGRPGKWRSRVGDPAGGDATSSTFQPRTITTPVGAFVNPGGGVAPVRNLNPIDKQVNHLILKSV